MATPGLTASFKDAFARLCQSDPAFVRLADSIFSEPETREAFLGETVQAILRDKPSADAYPQLIRQLLHDRQVARINAYLGPAGGARRLVLVCPTRAYRTTFGDIDRQLRTSGVRVAKIFIEYADDEFERSEGAFFAGFDIGPRIRNVDIFCSTTLIGGLHDAAKKILFMHDVFDSPLGDADRFLGGARLFDAFFVPSTLGVDSMQRVFAGIARPDESQDGKSHAIIRGGYPRLDLNIDYFRRHAAEENTIIYAPTPGLPEFESYVSVPHWVEPIVETLIEKFPDCRVIFRPHPHSLKRQKVQDVIARFKPHPRFEADLSGTDYMPSYSRAALMVSDTSGTAYTYAFTTGRPVVFFSPNEAEARARNPGVRYFDYRERVGLVAQNIEQLASAVATARRDAARFREPSFRLRDETVFNVGRACDYFVSIFDRLASGADIPGALYFRA
jgi:hypothetical protein